MNEKKGPARRKRPLPRRGGAPAFPTLPHRPASPGEKDLPAGVEWALRERIKELNCLYLISRLAESGSGDVEPILEEVVKVLPPALQFSEVAEAEIAFLDRAYQSPGFRLTPWALASPIRLHGETAGLVTVCYREERPPAVEGPFLGEERILLDAVAERIGAIAMRLFAERELTETNLKLRLERQALQDTNTTLKTLMARIEEEKREIRRDIGENVEKVLLPIVRQLHLAVPRPQRKLIELLGDTLEEITSPFLGGLTGRYPSLTPTEVQVCSAIRGGMRTKEISELRAISPATVHRHRERIRRKLGLTNSRANLTTFLRTNFPDAPASQEKALPPSRRSRGPRRSSPAR